MKRIRTLCKSIALLITIGLMFVLMTVAMAAHADTVPQPTPPAWPTVTPPSQPTPPVWPTVTPPPVPTPPSQPTPPPVPTPPQPPCVLHVDPSKQAVPAGQQAGVSVFSSCVTSSTSVTIDWGDGTTGQVNFPSDCQNVCGTLVLHTYQNAGEYTVTVTSASDSLTATATIDVLAQPTPPPVPTPPATPTLTVASAS